MHRCRTCGKTGHNSRTCGKTPPSPVSPAPARGTSPTRPAPTIGPSAIGDAYSHIDNSFKEDGQDTLDPVVETMTAQDIETWWLLTSGKTGKQETVPANYTTPDGRRRTTRRKEAVWETSDTERLESMVRIAVEQNTSVRALKRFLTTFGAHAKTELAYTRNPLPLPVYLALAKDPSAGVKERLAVRPDIPKQVLDVLADDKNVNVLALVASHRKTSPATLQKLFDDNAPRAEKKKGTIWKGYSEGYLEDALASNPHAPADVHRHYLNSEHLPTVCAAVRNARTTPEQLEHLWNSNREYGHGSVQVSEAIMGHRNTPPHVIDEYVNDVLGRKEHTYLSWYERKGLMSVAVNPQTSTRTLRRIVDNAKSNPFLDGMGTLTNTIYDTLKERNEPTGNV